MDSVLDTSVNKKYSLDSFFSISQVETDFSLWFKGTLKGGSQVRLKNTKAVFEEFLGGDIDMLIKFLEKFTQNPIACGLIHEMGEKVIHIVDKGSIKLTQYNCPMQESNPLCGHPELSKLAHAIFLAELLLNNHRYRRGISILRDIITLDELVGSLPNSGRDNKQQILEDQRDLSTQTIPYIVELTGALHRKYN